MSQSVSGLASTFENPSQTSQPPSNVSSIASRFEKPAQTSETAHVSEKLSGIASRFGTTIAEDPSKKPSTSNPTPQPPRTEPKPAPEHHPAQSFSDIHRRFASGPPPDESPNQPGMFAAAASAFRKREEEQKQPEESRVSQFAKSFESGAPDKSPLIPLSKGAAPEMATPLVQGREAGEVSQGVSDTVKNISSRFEGVHVAPVAPEKSVEEESPASSSDRFAGASKHFAEKVESVQSGDEDPNSLKNRFADATKLFGGAK